MAHDEGLAERVRDMLGAKTAFSERKMFGGLAFMVRGNMCVGILNDDLMARVGKAQHAAMLARKHIREMDFTGRPMAGYVFVGPDGVADDAALKRVIEACLAFNKSLPAK